jgi:hypothetical protein
MMSNDLDPSEIEVTVTNCEVTLSGSVDSRQAKFRAEQIAEDILGVKDVSNQLRVKRQLAGSTSDSGSSLGSSGTTSSSGSTTGSSGLGGSSYGGSSGSSGSSSSDSGSRSGSSTGTSGNRSGSGSGTTSR